jgi:hypothetical protein
MLPTALLLASVVVLSPALTKWKAEIEERDGGKIILVPIETDAKSNTMILPEDIEARPVLRRFFLSEDFRGQLASAHALTVNSDPAEGKFHFILLNMARAEQWREAEEALLAHEFGHIWLNATGYSGLPYQPGPDSCLAINAGDVVQHVLIRREMKRRGIPNLPYWLPNLERSLAALEQAGAAAPPLTGCPKLVQLTQWVDARLGLTVEDWSKLPRFLALLEKDYPDLAPLADDLAEYIGYRDISDPEQYRRVLEFSRRKFGKVAP